MKAKRVAKAERVAKMKRATKMKRKKRTVSDPPAPVEVAGSPATASDGSVLGEIALAFEGSACPPVDPGPSTLRAGRR